MGPPPFGGGKTGRATRSLLDWTASMGPPPFGGGKTGRATRSLLDWTASMGPPPFGGGKSPVKDLPASISIQLQWGRRLSAVESSPVLSLFRDFLLASMGPPPFGGGKLQPSPILSGARDCFNGAAAFRRWKEPKLPHPHFRCWVASMGPPPFGGGKFVGHGNPNRLPFASMGPPPFGGGKYSAPRL